MRRLLLAVSMCGAESIGSMVWDWHACVGDRMGSAHRYADKKCGCMLPLLGLAEGCHGVLRYCRIGSRVEGRSACVGASLGQRVAMQPRRVCPSGGGVKMT